MSTKYYLGLDIGTASVGWAVTDENYKVVKRSGKSLWGVRLFEQGETAQERRLNRSARRRLGRKKWRLKLLRELFKAEIEKVDSEFFLRLSESKFFEEDKKVDGTDSLFHDDDYTDRTFHKHYPTAYHLRKDMMVSKEPDIRLVYLAIAHILKSRGHFLNEGLELNVEKGMEEALDDFQGQLLEQFDFNLRISVDDIKNILNDEKLGKRDKMNRIKKQIANGDSSVAGWFNIAIMGDVKAKTLFPDVDSKTNISINFYKEDLDTILTKLEAQLNEDQIDLLSSAFRLFSAFQLSNILGDYQTLSDAKIAAYEKHHKDLRILKTLVQQYLPKEYYGLFHAVNSNENYAAYIGYSYIDGKKVYTKTSVKKNEIKENFYKNIIKVLAKIKELNPDLPGDDTSIIKQILNDIDQGNFLPKLRTSDNGVIPYQVHKIELEKILRNVEKYYPFMYLKDENGLTVSERIIRLFEFKIPYYVGPINTAHKDSKDGSGFTWVEKREGYLDTPITPYNFYMVVDEEKSEEAFIKRMTNECSYLYSEDVLPLNSFLYAKFIALNLLNPLKIKGEPIPTDLKQRLYKRLFLQEKSEKIIPNAKITLKSIVRFLKSEGYTDVLETDISGIEKEEGIANPFQAYLKIKKIFGKNCPDLETIEACIRSLTFSEKGSKRIRKNLTKILNGKASKDQIKAISRLDVAGWGRLSKKLLTGIYSVDPMTGAATNIIDMLYDSNENLNQLLSSKYTFSKSIKNQNDALKNNDHSFTYDNLVSHLYASPAVKKSIWQTLKIVKEVTNIMGREPEKIFIEMARDHTDAKKGVRTESRKTKLESLYKSCKKDLGQWGVPGIAEQLSQKTDQNLFSKKLYLYFLQMGKCMYSGETIELDNLFDNIYYDIDHIYPRSKVKDDSFDNLVLVKKELNDIKKDYFPIDETIRAKQKAFWTMLLDKGLISREKYYRLTRPSRFSEDELTNFINRQLVETRQSTKEVAHILEDLFPGSKIVYVKAGLTSDFRDEFKLVKVREINDLHHAKDAYLNIVVGNYYFNKFTNDPRGFVKRKTDKNENYSIKTVTLFKGMNLSKDGEVIWEKGKNGTIKTVKQQMLKNNILLTKQSYCGHGKFYNQTIEVAGPGNIPLKKDPRLSDTNKYGGYTSASVSFLCLIKLKPSGKLRFISIPVYAFPNRKPSKAELHDFVSKNYEIKDGKKISDFEIIIQEIKLNTKIQYKGNLYYIIASSKKNNNMTLSFAIPLVLPDEMERYAKKLVRFSNLVKQTKGYKVDPKYDDISINQNKQLYNLLVEKMTSIPFNRLAKYHESFKAALATFENLPIEDQVETLMEMLRIFNQCTTEHSFKLLNVKSVNRFRPLLTSIDFDTVIYDVSVTGFYQKEIRFKDFI